MFKGTEINKLFRYFSCLMNCRIVCLVGWKEHWRSLNH